MTTQELAEKLHGREYGSEISPEWEKVAKENNLVVVFGASGDLMEFRGAISEEVGAYDGGEAYLTPTGQIVEPDIEDRNVFMKYGVPMPRLHLIEAKWEPGAAEGIPQGASWLITSDIPHSTFDIFEDGELYCRGIVFSLKDIH